MVVDYLSSQPNRAGYQVSTKQGSGPPSTTAGQQHASNAASSTPNEQSAEVSQVLFRLSRWENLEYAKKI